MPVPVSAPASTPAPVTEQSRVPAVGLAVAVGLVALSIVLPWATGWNVHVNTFPPLHADWDPRVGAGTLPALVVALVAGRWAVDAADRLPWRRLLLASYGIGVAWLFALALVDGTHGIGHILGTHYEYLQTARATHDVPAMLHEYVARIPADVAGSWPVHVAGHPPAAVLFFVLLSRLGLGSDVAAGSIVALVAASTAVALLVTLRTLGAETLARRAAPFLVLGPAAVWQAVSADALFAAVAAWGMAALALAAVRRRVGWALLAGLLLGTCVMLSYGLPLLGVLALAVLVLARSWRPLPWAAGAAAAVVLGFAALGFVWWEALPVLHARQYSGVARNRPAAYWMWGDLAALTVSAGPMLGAGLATAAAAVRDTGARVAVWLSGAAVVMVLLADASQMSKGEVERIFLPFEPWLLVSTALLPERWRRSGLVVQLATALVVQHLLDTGW